MLAETLQWLGLEAGGVVADLTMGLGGHGREIIRQVGPTGTYLGIEWDADTFARAHQALAEEPAAHLFNENFVQLPALMAQAGVPALDGALLDAGVNLWQLTDPERSLSHDSEVGLDMRMQRSPDRPPATVIVNEADEALLTEILKLTLADREAARIARAIVRARAREPITTTRRLGEVILSTLTPQARRTGRQPYPALLAFRIYVNDELDNLAQGIEVAARALQPGSGRLVVLTFHSAEFRCAKDTMRRLAGICDCPPRLPCLGNHEKILRLLTPKPPGPDEASLQQSGRQCRSCRLHAAQAV
jgi:16S rRNA (cytosine1402-N4)-methyltransferase